MQDFLERLLKALHARAIVVIADTDFAGTISRRASHEYIRGPGKNLLPVDHLLQVICSSSSNERDLLGIRQLQAQRVYSCIDHFAQGGQVRAAPSDCLVDP
jgi:hypothetical protein